MYCATLPRACTGVLVCWLAPCWLAGVVLTASRAARRLSARLSARAATQLSARGPLRGNDGPLRGGGVGPLRGSQLTTVFTTCAATWHCGTTAVQSSFLKPRRCPHLGHPVAEVKPEVRHTSGRLCSSEARGVAPGALGARPTARPARPPNSFALASDH